MSIRMLLPGRSAPGAARTPLRICQLMKVITALW